MSYDKLRRRLFWGDMFFGTLIMVLLLFAFAGCASQPVAASPFERCMSTVATGMTYLGERMKSAEWCAANLGALR